MVRAERPLSPFWVYRWQITNTLSILHRLTGGALSIGLIALVAWLITVASGPETYAMAADRVFATTWFKVPLIGWVFCLFFHLANGIRHLVWDVGRGFDPNQIRIGGWIVVIAAVLATGIYTFMVIV